MPPLATLVQPSRVRRFLAAHFPAPPGGVFRAQARRFTTAQVLVHAFYAFLLFTAAAQFADAPALLRHSPSAPLWPVAWLGRGDDDPRLRLLVLFYLATNVLGAFVSSWRAGRVLTFLGLLEFVAYKNSYGKIGHSLHLPLYVAAILILLPAGWDRPDVSTDRRQRQTTLLVLWLAQAAVLLSYTMSGVAKIAAALYQLVAGQGSAFAPGGLSAIVAQRLLETHSSSLLGAFIVHHPWLTWPALPAAIYLETGALLMAFRPALARPWALLLILFHVGTFFTMTISFPQNCFLLALFFLASPFEPAPALPWQARLRLLPLVSTLYKLAPTRR